jgi:hypothetical protein
MVIISRAFVFLNCDIGIERVIIRGNEGHHMPLSNQGVAACERDEFWQPCCNENLFAI